MVVKSKLKFFTWSLQPPKKYFEFILFKAIVNLFNYEKNMTLFLHKSTHHTFPCKKGCFFLSIHFSFPVPLLFLFHFKGQRFKGALLFLMTSRLQVIPNEKILLCMDYDEAFRLEKNES